MAPVDYSPPSPPASVPPGFQVLKILLEACSEGTKFFVKNKWARRVKIGSIGYENAL